MDICALDDVPDISAIQILGRGLNLTAISGQDFTAALSFNTTAIARVSPVLKLGALDHSVSLCDGAHCVPNKVTVSTETRTTASFCAIREGAAMREALKANAGFSMRYSSFAGGESCVYAASKSFLDDHQYVLFDMSHVYYTASLQYDADQITKVCEDEIKDLPEVFTSDCLGQYMKFFRDYGTHAITGATFGSRLNLICWIAERDIKAHGSCPEDNLDSITSGQELMDHIWQQKGLPRLFQSNIHTRLFAVGDYESIAESMNTRARDRRLRHDARWIFPASHTAELISVRLEEIWAVARASLDPDIRCRAQALEDAFRWNTSHPITFKTAARVLISSDWAEFTLNTPGATIVRPRSSGNFPETIKLRSGKVQWGNPGSFAFGRIVIQFDIYHDRFPIEFSTGHGSLGPNSSMGKIIVKTRNKQYRNDHITDNLWNIQLFQHGGSSNIPDIHPNDM